MKRIHFREEQLIERAESGSELLPELTLEGYAAVFNESTEIWGYTESIAEGAFTESISRGDDIAALIDHDTSKIIARTPDTLELSEDKRGLKVRIKPAKTTIGNDLVENVRARNIRQMSIGFFIEEEVADFTRDMPHFEVRKARLFDVSAVTFPAYKNTEIALSRSGCSKQQIENDLEERIKRHNKINPELFFQKRSRLRKIISLGM